MCYKDGTWYNMLHIGKPTVNDAFLIPYQQYKVDKKLDDGHSQSGKMSYKVLGTVTDASCSGTESDYDLTSNTVGCNIIMELD